MATSINQHGPALVYRSIRDLNPAAARFRAPRVLVEYDQRNGCEGAAARSWCRLRHACRERFQMRGLPRNPATSTFANS